VNILLRILLYLVFFVFIGCTTHESFVTEHKDAWLNDLNDGLFYCRANVKDSGLADPVCFEAGFHRYDDLSEEKNKKTSTKK
jgi:hypothetical protein